MPPQDYSLDFETSKSADAVFAAINNVEGWWSGQFKGRPDALGAEFTYEVPDVHWCKLRVTAFDSGRRIVWAVTESQLHFTKTKNDWDGTEIRFELTPTPRGTRVRFAHVGLSPRRECYDACSGGWNVLLEGNLPNLIATGLNQPDAFR